MIAVIILIFVAVIAELLYFIFFLVSTYLKNKAASGEIIVDAKLGKSGLRIETKFSKNLEMKNQKEENNS